MVDRPVGGWGRGWNSDHGNVYSQIGLLFVCLAVLEDSGYLARAAFVMDRLMRWMGLPGKAFVPMLVGFGCNIPGIMATRTLENAQDRLLAALINHFMSCGARLPVYALICAAFFPAMPKMWCLCCMGWGLGRRFSRRWC